MPNIPQEFQSTVKMLRSAFGNELPSEYLPILMAVMKESGMSDRNVASALGYYYGTSYMELLHDVATCLQDLRVNEITIAKMKKRLRPHGFDAWSRED